MEKPSSTNWLDSQTEPEILSVLRDGNLVEVDILMSVELFQFQGHFPEQPIFPGVAQLDWAARLSAKYFGNLGTIVGLSQIKFTNLIEPGDRLCLTLELQPEKRRVFFAFKQGENKCSSGCLELSPK
ncbi:beta-hydroxyacyl-ACP dehydratase [Sneathiella marina]|uniref:Beta-hydroxyacyl-ACP dehydratase n=1 Tax=Sneathiella marina TaxID=2950108 RepID=A0ABY4W6J1_9PROT|nr:3-hydroxyacyl-ACP dehydratase FabZ family protein [Sneathiella marina]USG62617.1 beta-hydroxyacyl-ACP dehydratase [Sneathiella marina]